MTPIYTNVKNNQFMLLVNWKLPGRTYLHVTCGYVQMEARSHQTTHAKWS